MNYSEIKKVTIENGPGVRVSLFVSGCRNHCKGCFQPETWDFNYGKPFDEKALEELLEALRPTYIRGLSILGGDPMEPENQDCVLWICKTVKERYPNKDIWLYTGYLYDQFANFGTFVDGVFYKQYDRYHPILDFIDVMVDGSFIEMQKDLGLPYRGSRNQRLIDVKNTKDHLPIIQYVVPNPMKETKEML